MGNHRRSFARFAVVACSLLFAAQVLGSAVPVFAADPTLDRPALDRSAPFSRLGGPVAPVPPAAQPPMPDPHRTLPQTIVGPATAIDGDTIDIRGERIRLDGIDAPELAQSCKRTWIGEWPCGTAALSHLAKLIANEVVTCATRGLDKYRRVLAVCYVQGRDINATLVENGLAWAFVRYSQAYVTQEARAREAKRGIWVADTLSAWDFRAQKWGSADVKQATAPEGCVIKGAVTKNGKIYHMPWSPWYDKIRIDDDPVKRGERRWFCSESEAINAGWRPVR